MKYHDTYDLIEAYLQGKMSKEDRLNFEQSLEVDSDLKKEYKYHKLANDMLINERLNQLNKTLKDRNKQEKFNWKLAMGLVLLGAIIVGGIIYLHQPHKDASKIENTKTDIVFTPKKEESPSGIKNKVNIPEKNQERDASINLTKNNILKNDYLPEKDTIIQEDNSVVNQIDTTELIELNVVEFLDSVKLDTKELNIDKDKRVNDNLHSQTLTQNEVDTLELNLPAPLILAPKKTYLEISPLYDLYDEFPFDDNESGILYIYTKKGVLIKKMDIEDGEPSYWDGKDNNGSINAGYYVFKFESSSNNMLTGGITIIY